MSPYFWVLGVVPVTISGGNPNSQHEAQPSGLVLMSEPVLCAAMGSSKLGRVVWGHTGCRAGEAGHGEGGSAGASAPGGDGNVAVGEGASKQQDGFMSFEHCNEKHICHMAILQHYRTPANVQTAKRNKKELFGLSCGSTHY